MGVACLLLGHKPDKVDEQFPVEEYECERCGAFGMRVTGSTLHGHAHIKWE